MTTQFRPVITDADKRELADLAHEIWFGFWPAHIGQAQTEYIVENFQSLAAIRRDMAHAGYEYWFVMDDAGQTCGYTGGHVEAETARFFISKIYLREEHRGRGLARDVLAFYEHLCAERGLRAMYLTVNKYNELGIRCYQGKGFETIDAVETDIGQGFVMDDYIMEKAVAPVVAVGPEADIDARNVTVVPQLTNGTEAGTGTDGAAGLSAAAGSASPAAGRLIVMDIDSTLINEEVIDLLGEEAGVGERVAAITERAMRGELDFEGALRERVALLAGLDAAVLDRTYGRVTLTRGARELVRAAHARGWKVGVVSGGFHEVADRIAADAGIDFCLANSLEVADGALTGRTLGPVVTKDLKLATLEAWAAELGLGLERCVAIGDGANDIPMICAAGTGIAFCAKPATRAAAPHAVDDRNLLLALNLVDGE